MKEKSDFLFLGLLGLLIANTITQSIAFGYILSLNNYLGFVTWGLALVLRLGHFKRKRYALAFLLILGTLNVSNFGLGMMSMSFSIGHISNAPAEPIGLNPIILLMLIGYYFVNMRSINRLLSNAIKGSEEERKVDHQKIVDFYLRKFNECDDSEFEKVYRNFNEYPPEAQTALKQIRQEKEKRSTT